MVTFHETYGEAYAEWALRRGRGGDAAIRVVSGLPECPAATVFAVAPRDIDIIAHIEKLRKEGK